MKKLWGLIFVCAGLAAPGFCRGQDATEVALSQKEAVREFPALADASSNFNRRFLERVGSLRTGNDSLMLRDDWPLLVAKQVAMELGVDPVPEPRIVQRPAATPTPTPWVPMGTMLDRPAGSTGDTLLDPIDPDGTSAGPQKMGDGRFVSQKKYFIYGTVMQKTDKGLLVFGTKPRAIGYETPQGYFWLDNKDGSQGAHVEATAYKLANSGHPGYDEYEAQ